jgi:hypothetical protein
MGTGQEPQRIATGMDTHSITAPPKTPLQLYSLAGTGKGGKTQDLTLLRFMGDVPHIAGQEMAIGARHAAPSLEPLFHP